jgi:hypothetical protein
VLEHHPEARMIVTKKLEQIAQVVVCSPKDTPDRVLLVAHTHLFYHPLADYARLMQSYAILTQLERMRKGLVDGVTPIADVVTRWTPGDTNGVQLPGIVSVTIPEGRGGRDGGVKPASPVASSVACIFAGDLNSTPGGPLRGTDDPPNAVMELALDGQVTADNDVWWTLDQFKWGRKRGEGYDVEEDPDRNSDGATLLSHDMRLVSAAGLPECSNYSVGFKALLDYIFVESDAFEVLRAAPVPSMARMGRDTAIPSSTFPSDHVPISVDLRLR